MKKTIIITGSTSGIGNALVKEFAKENTVFAGYRNEKYVEELCKIFDNIKPFYIDMSSKSSIAQASAYIKSEAEKIDTLINGAGCVIAGAMEKLDVDKIRNQFEVNTFGHLDFSQRLLPILAENGKIINISSMASFGIFPFVGPYCASKRALDILFNSIQLESHKNVKIVSIKPGVIATPLWGKSIDLNKSSIDNSSGFEKEMKYMISNAKQNEVKGLSINKVVDLIIKVENSSRPKASYIIGRDALFAEMFSKLPQDWINAIVKLGMKHKFNS